MLHTNLSLPDFLNSDKFEKLTSSYFPVGNSKNKDILHKKSFCYVVNADIPLLYSTIHANMQ